MAELVGIYAASHSPLIMRDREKLPPDKRQGLERSFAELGRRLERSHPDILVMIGADHFGNFFLENFPTVLVGAGAEHTGPPEPWLADKAPATLAGHPDFAQHLLRTALERDFDPAVSQRMALDHGYYIPIWASGLKDLPPIVPVMMNAIEPPLPTLRRCYRWGELIREAIASYAEPARIAVFATGGLSHSSGEARMGQIDEVFDQGCIAHLTQGAAEPLFDFVERRLPLAGNGANEIRYWIAAHGAAGGHGFESLHYAPIPETYTGCCVAAWNLR